MKRYVIFSAIRRSPTSKLGYIDKDGMNRGSAINLFQHRSSGRLDADTGAKPRVISRKTGHGASKRSRAMKTVTISNMRRSPGFWPARRKRCLHVLDRGWHTGSCRVRMSLTVVGTQGCAGFACSFVGTQGLHVLDHGWHTGFARP